MPTTDYFALLTEPRRPWLDAEALKEKFLALSAGVHPDRAHALGESERAAAQERYVALNAAFQCLRDPKERLRHLLEVERGAVRKEIQEVPSELMDFSLALGRVCRAADGLATEKAGLTSPLLKVQFFERSQPCLEELGALQQQAIARRERLIAELKAIDREWDSAGDSRSSERAAQLLRIEELHRQFSYCDRWIQQAQERAARLVI